MNRKLLIDLLHSGMKYAIGKHQIWISRCFVLTVRPNQVVEVDEYEAYDEKKEPHAKDRNGMYHIGRSVISTKEKRVIEEVAGKGWIRAGNS